MRLRTATAALLMLPSALLAQPEARGTISGTLALDDAVWDVDGEDTAIDSRWREKGTGRVVRIVGFPEQTPEAEDGQPGSDGMLVIEFALAGNPTESEVRSPRATHHVPGGGQIHADEVDIDLSPTALAVEGESMALSGDVVAAMTPGGKEGSRWTWRAG